MCFVSFLSQKCCPCQRRRSRGGLSKSVHTPNHDKRALFAHELLCYNTRVHAHTVHGGWRPVPPCSGSLFNPFCVVITGVTTLFAYKMGTRYNIPRFQQLCETQHKARFKVIFSQCLRNTHLGRSWRRALHTCGAEAGGYGWERAAKQDSRHGGSAARKKLHGVRPAPGRLFLFQPLCIQSST